jgi:hypothetical protein
MGGYLEQVRRLKRAEVLPQKKLTDCTTTPSYEKNEINEKSTLRQSVEERVNSWTIPDAEDLVAQWEGLGCPQIPLSSGISISNLRKWMNAHSHSQLSEAHLTTVRHFLWEGLPASEVPSTDPLLEEWQRVSIPEWQRILQESIAGGDKRREEYARWMLKEVLQDPDDKEDQP